MTSHSEFGHNTTAAEVADAFDGQIKGRIGTPLLLQLQSTKLTFLFQWP